MPEGRIATTNGLPVPAGQTIGAYSSAKRAMTSLGEVDNQVRIGFAADPADRGASSELGHPRCFHRTP